MEKIKEVLKEVLSFIVTFLVVYGLARLLFMYVAQPVNVDGRSMDYTLQHGERLILNRLAKPERFDVVVVSSHDDEDKLYIKRIIGMPGDTIEFKDEKLILNGVETDEIYLNEKRQEYLSQGDYFTSDATLYEMTGEFKVPEGKVFVCGDNRRNSSDSRNLGFFDLDDIQGETKIVLWPLDRLGKLDKYELDDAGQIVKVE